jgi:hypothetical protein
VLRDCPLVMALCLNVVDDRLRNTLFYRRFTPVDYNEFMQFGNSGILPVSGRIFGLRRDIVYGRGEIKKSTTSTIRGL